MRESPKSKEVAETKTTSAQDTSDIHISGALERAIRDLAALWRKSLVKLDRRNSALYFRPLKTGTLAVANYENPALTALIDESRPLDIVDTLEWSDDSARRLASIRAKARENEKEHGICRKGGHFRQSVKKSLSRWRLQVTISRT